MYLGTVSGGAPATFVRTRGRFVWLSSVVDGTLRSGGEDWRTGMQWMRTDDGEDLIFHVGPRLRMGWNRSAESYWIEELDVDGERLIERVDWLSEGQRLTDIEDLTDAAVVWNAREDDDDLVEWGENQVLLSQLLDAQRS